MADSTGFLHCRRERGGIDIADVDEFGIIRMAYQRTEMVFGDTAASDKREADLPAGDGGRNGHGIRPLPHWLPQECARGCR